MKEIGLILQESRESRGLNIKDAAKELKIRSAYIQMLEQGDTAAVSKEIYIIGYLKSYAKWLGLDSNELVSQLKLSETNFNVTQACLPDSPKLFSIEEGLARPGRKLVFASIILTIVIYVAWNRVENPEIIKTFSGAYLQGKQLDGTENQAALTGQNFLLMTRDKISLKIYNVDGSFLLQELDKDEIYFLSTDNQNMIVADKPHLIDVFIDDTNNTPLGTLEQVQKVN